MMIFIRRSESNRCWMFTGEKYGSVESKPGRDRVLGNQSGRGRSDCEPSEGFSAAGAAGTGREGISDPPEHIEAAGILLLRGVRGRGRLRGPSANRALQEHHCRPGRSQAGKARAVPVPVHLTSEPRSNVSWQIGFAAWRPDSDPIRIPAPTFVLTRLLYKNRPAST